MNNRNEIIAHSKSRESPGFMSRIGIRTPQDGKIEVDVPRVREDRFEPQLLTKHRALYFDGQQHPSKGSDQHLQSCVDLTRLILRKTESRPREGNASGPFSL